LVILCLPSSVWVLFAFYSKSDLVLVTNVNCRVYQVFNVIFLNRIGLVLYF